MVPIGDAERLREFPRSRAELVEIVNAAASLHQLGTTPWFKRADQNEAVRVPFHEHIQHPVHAVVEIDVGRTGFVSLDKSARARPRKGVRGFVIDCRVRFGLDNDPGAIAPDQLRADEFARARKRIALKKFPWQHRDAGRCACHFHGATSPAAAASGSASCTRCTNTRPGSSA